MAPQKLEVNENVIALKSSRFYYVRDGHYNVVIPNVLIFILGHILFVYATYVMFAEMPIATYLYTGLLTLIIGYGVTGGAHRLWAHKSYEAKWPLRLLLMIGQTLSGQNCIYIWARDHRVHHKWSDTDGDPHNTKRGFFFAHVGWLMTKKHPEMIIKAKTLDFSDLDKDPIVRFQKNYYWILYFLLSFYIPIAIPVYGWGEKWTTSFLLAYVGRYLVTLHGTWFVNSAAHMFGEKPYNGEMAPAENPWVSFIGFGEGYHNYHHQFPFDYQASEHGHGFNATRHFIDFMARIGQADHLRTASDAVIGAAKAKQLSKKREEKGIENELFSRN